MMRGPKESLSDTLRLARMRRKTLRGRKGGKTCLICPSSYYRYIYRKTSSENGKHRKEADRTEWMGGVTSEKGKEF